jgi:hypothetical protein
MAIVRKNLELLQRWVCESAKPTRLRIRNLQARNAKLGRASWFIQKREKKRPDSRMDFPIERIFFTSAAVLLPKGVPDFYETSLMERAIPYG